MRKFKGILQLFCCVALICVCPVVAQGADEVTQDDVIALVNKAVALLEKDGDAALEVISTKDGDFHHGSLYAFVYDEKVNMLAHPVKPQLIGKNYAGKPDVMGNEFRDWIVDAAMEEAEGDWTQYVYEKPGESVKFDKEVFSKLAEKDGKKYIVAAGRYADK